MKKRDNIVKLFTAMIGFTLLIGCSVQKIVLQENDLRLVNRKFIRSTDLATGEIALNNQEGDGLAILKDVKFDVGTIEIDIQGENKPGQSFVGIAFNIQNDSTYEAIYFRPFNFQAKEKIRREHGMQYIFHPTYSWRKLRTEQEGVFEAEFLNPPNPTDWFTVQLKITDDMIEVVDKRNNNKLLTVKRLSSPVSQRVGLWTGYDSKGRFRNLSIQK